MPVQTTKSNLAGMLKKHAADPVEVPQDFSRLPGGANGEAELFSLAIGTYKPGTKLQGKRFFRAAGTVINPKTCIEEVPYLKLVNNKPVMANGKPVVEKRPGVEKHIQGLQTSIMEPLCETGKGDKVVSQDEHVKEMLNHLKLLGGEEFVTEALQSLPDNATEEQSLKHLESCFQTLIKDDSGAPRRIRFRFSTRYGNPSVEYPTPMVFETWYGTEGVSNHESNGQAMDAGAATQDGTQVGSADAFKEAEEAAAAGTESTATSEEVDLDELATNAGTDAEAGETLKKIAVDCGALTEDEVDNSDSWESVVEAIRAKSNEGEKDEANAEQAAEPWEAKKGEIAWYKPADPKDKTGKKRLKAVECTIDSIDKKAKPPVAKLTRLDNGKTFEKVPVSLLQESAE